MRRRLEPALLLCLGLAASQGVSSQDEPLGRSAAFDKVEAGPSILVAPGLVLRTRPDRRAEVIVVIKTAVELPILESRRGWVRTLYEGQIGWLADGDGSVSQDSEAQSSTPLVLDTTVSERAARVASARSLLRGENTRATKVGPWRLYTDIADAALVGRLDRIADRLPAVYQQRYGLPAATIDPRVVVLFAAEGDYRRFTEQSPEIADLHSGGHADQAMAALFAAEGSPEELESILVHELVHLLNRDHFVDSPQSWLEEGLASDLGVSRIDSDGKIQLGTLGGTATLSRGASSRFLGSVRTGGQALWNGLLRDWRQHRNQFLPLHQLLDLPWPDFVEERSRTSRYSQSTFLLRFLLDDSGDEMARSFHAFLLTVADGGPSGADALCRGLNLSSADLESRYERWLTRHAARLR